MRALALAALAMLAAAAARAAVPFNPIINFMTVHYTPGTGCAANAKQFAQNWTGQATPVAFGNILNGSNCNPISQYPPIPRFLDQIDNLPESWVAACNFQNLDKGALLAYFYFASTECLAIGSRPVQPIQLSVGEAGLSCYSGIFNATDIKVYHTCPNYIESSASGAALSLTAALLATIAVSVYVILVHFFSYKVARGLETSTTSLPRSPDLVRSASAPGGPTLPPSLPAAVRSASQPLLRQTPASRMLVFFASVVVAVGVGGLYLRRKYGQTLNGLLYNLYVRTPLAQIMHERSLSQQRTKAPHSYLAAEEDRVHRLWNQKGYIRLCPYLADNFGYLVVCNETGQAAFVDPGDAQAVLACVEEESKSRHQKGAAPLRLTKLLVTHHHADHSGGISELVRFDPSLEVVGGARDRITKVTRMVAGGDTVSLGRVSFNVLDTPGHTNGHVTFALGQEALFTGDFVFSGGCGRFFEGGADDMASSFAKLRSFPDSTLIFCGHEYTVSNLAFALRLAQGHSELCQFLEERMAWAKARRETKRPTIPSSLGVERRINLFLQGTNSLVADLTARVAAAQSRLVVKSGSEEGADVRIVNREDPASVVRALRALKDAGI